MITEIKDPITWKKCRETVETEDTFVVSFQDETSEEGQMRKIAKKIWV